MAIVPIKPYDFDPRFKLLTDIISLIDQAASSSEPVSPPDLARDIMEAIDASGYTPEPVQISSKELSDISNQLSDMITDLDD